MQDDIGFITEEISSSLEWRVIHLRYPRETQTYSALQIKWVAYGNIKLPKFFFQQKTLEKQEARVNYDLLCCKIETLLNKHSTEGYELFSMNSTHSGFFSTAQGPTRPQHHFLKSPVTKNSVRGDEVLIFIFRKKP